MKDGDLGGLLRQVSLPNSKSTGRRFGPVASERNIVLPVDLHLPCSVLPDCGLAIPDHLRTVNLKDMCREEGNNMPNHFQQQPGIWIESPNKNMSIKQLPVLYASLGSTCHSNCYCQKWQILPFQKGSKLLGSEQILMTADQGTPIPMEAIAVKPWCYNSKGLTSVETRPSTCDANRAPTLARACKIDDRFIRIVFDRADPSLAYEDRVIWGN